MHGAQMYLYEKRKTIIGSNFSTCLKNFLFSRLILQFQVMQLHILLMQFVVSQLDRTMSDYTNWTSFFIICFSDTLNKLVKCQEKHLQLTNEAQNGIGRDSLRRKLHMLCFLTSFWVLSASNRWLKYFFRLFSNFFVDF